MLKKKISGAQPYEIDLTNYPCFQEQNYNYGTIFTVFCIQPKYRPLSEQFSLEIHNFTRKR